MARVYAGARCPRCGSRYAREEASFLYSDESGYYCECGGILVEDRRAEEEKRPVLTIPERLEGSALHRWLELRGVEIMMDRTAEVRAIRPGRVRSVAGVTG
ncbi:MAG: hypothetical protein AB1425_18360 [Actinomycetota bacterium]